MLSNHLGNVLETISDKKIGHITDATTIDYYNANVVTGNDYYPGGMQMPGRTYQATSQSKYRYSINGQEKSDELNDNLTSAKYWEYDSRIVRRWNTDPVVKPWESPYAAFGNNPIFLIDPDGLDWYKNGKTGDAQWFKGDRKHKGFDYLGNKDWGDKHMYFNTKKNLLSEVVVVGHRTKLDLEKPKTIDDKVAAVEEKVGTVNSVASLTSKEGSKVFKFTEGLDKALTVYDMGRGMHSLVSNRNPSDANFMAGLPVVGGFFAASGDLLNEQEKSLVEANLKGGYQTTLPMLAHSGSGRRSGLTSLWVTEDVYNSVRQQGCLNMSAYKWGTQILKPDETNWYFPTDMNGVKFSYLLVFPAKSPSKIKATEILIQKVQ